MRMRGLMITIEAFAFDFVVENTLQWPRWDMSYWGG